MSPPEREHMILVSFPHLCVEEGSDIPTLEINKTADIGKGESIVQILLGEKLIVASNNSHIPIEYKIGEGRLCLMARIYNLLPEEMTEYVENTNRTMYIGPKEVYRALGDMLMGDGDGNKSKP